MKGAAGLVMDWMVKDPDGKWVTNPSTSPENNFLVNGERKGSVSIASTMDLSIIHDLLNRTILAAETLGKDADLVKQMKFALRNMYPFQAGRLGQLQEWYKDWDDPKDKHRHLSHLYGVYPGNAIPRAASPSWQRPPNKACC